MSTEDLEELEASLGPKTECKNDNGSKRQRKQRYNTAQEFPWKYYAGWLLCIFESAVILGLLIGG